MYLLFLTCYTILVDVRFLCVQRDFRMIGDARAATNNFTFEKFSLVSVHCTLDSFGAAVHMFVAVEMILQYVHEVGRRRLEIWR